MRFARLPGLALLFRILGFMSPPSKRLLFRHLHRYSQDTTVVTPSTTGTCVGRQWSAQVRHSQL